MNAARDDGAREQHLVVGNVLLGLGGLVFVLAVFGLVLPTELPFISAPAMAVFVVSFTLTRSVATSLSVAKRRFPRHSRLTMPMAISA
jgi:hypothetical protein